MNQKELLESIKHLITPRTIEQRKYSIKLLKISWPQQMTTKRKKYNLDKSYYDFLITRTIESTRIWKYLYSEQWWMLRIKIWIIRSKRTLLKEDKRLGYYRFLKKNWKII